MIGEHVPTNALTALGSGLKDLKRRLESLERSVLAVKPNAPWTPTFANLTAGTGAVSAGRYAFRNGVLSCWGYVILGTSPTVGSVQVDLPAGFATDAVTFRQPFGSFQMVDDNGAVHVGIVRHSSSTRAQLLRYSVSGSSIIEAVISATAPFTWAVNDSIGFEFHVPAHRV